VTVIGELTGKARAQGVRQDCPFEVLASAPGGSDSNRTVSIIGDGLTEPRFSQSGDDEHAASASEPPTTIKTRYIV